MLFESQEVIFQKISEVFSQSPHSTKVDKLKETLLQGLGNFTCTSDANLEESDSCPKYDLRTRTVIKQSINMHLQRQTNDFSLSKRTRFKKKKKESYGDQFSLNNTESSETCEYSQESVSMLQDCYEKISSKNEFPELMETCMNTELDIINIYSDEEVDDADKGQVNKSPLGFTKVGVEVSTQTECTVSKPEFQNELTRRREIEIAKHAKFISSVVKLKAVLSSKKNVSDGKLRNILNKRNGEEDYNDGWSVPTETIGYLFRSSDAENIFRETVQVLLTYLEDALRENFSKIACFWKNSAYEMAAGMLNEAVDSEIGVRKMIETFLFRIIGSILRNEEKLKNVELESKAMLVVSFCKSTHLSYAAINYIIGLLETVKTIRRHTEHASIEEKLSLTYVSKNSYFLLRILESLLEIFKTKLVEGKIGNVFPKKSEVKNFNVLEMWKRHWNKNEKVPVEQEATHEWETTVSKWCDMLNEVSLHCVNHIPVLSMAVERCAELAKEILKISHPKILPEKQNTALPGEDEETDTYFEMDF